jgi:hypothetical protein
MNPDSARPAAAASTADRPPLDDIMLAMDVVDTLRRRERLVTRELDEIGREEDLKGRLKRIYEQQGIDVPDHVIEQGVAALRDDRFTYRPPTRGLAYRLARIYVTRARWGKWLGALLAAAVLAGGIYWFAVAAPARALPQQLSQRHAELAEIAQTDQARQVVQQAYESGSAALRREDRAQARQALAELEQLSALLNQDYVIRIINRPGEPSGVWRIPDVNQQARNYYVIVEALSPSGETLRVPILNEETGRTETVDTWGVRVDEATFEAVRRDKRDDGIIQNNRFGSKPRGHLAPNYAMPTSGGTITQW